MSHAASGPWHTASERTVVIVASQDPKNPKGGELVAVLTLCRALVDAGLDVWLLTPCLREETFGAYTRFDGGLQVVRLRGRSTASTMYGLHAESRRAREAFAHEAVAYVTVRFRPAETIMHLHGGFPELPQRAGILKDSGFPVVSTWHMFASERAERLGEPARMVTRLRRDEAEAIALNPSVIVHGSPMVDSLYRILPEYGGAVNVMPLGLSDENFTETNGSSQPRKRHITAYGRISPEKGFEAFLLAARIVTDRRRRQGLPAVDWLLFGKTDESIEARRQYRQRLEHLARGYDNIRLMLSPQGIWGDKRIRLVDESLIGVVPSRYEPWGYVCAELMARGVPVVSTPTHGARAIHGTDIPGPTPFGFLAQDTPEDVANGIEFLLNHPNLLRQVGRNAADMARHEYGAAKYAQTTRTVYEHLVA